MAPKSRSTRRSRATPDSGAAPSWPRRRSQRSRPPTEGPRVRERAPALGRGGRSGVGVATFEAGGFVLDAGHPTARFTTDRPADGEWTVPPVAARHAVPDDWRFLLVRPDADPGRSGDAEDDAMRTAVERAEPGLADRIGGIVTRRVLPRSRPGTPSASAPQSRRSAGSTVRGTPTNRAGSTARRSATWSHRCRTPRPCSAPGSRRGADRIRNHGRRERDCGRERGRARPRRGGR